MKICFFAESYTPVINGTSISLQHIVVELCARGHEVYVVAPYHPDQPHDEQGVIRYRSISLPKRFDSRFGLPSSSFLLPRLAAIQPDIFHPQQPSTSGRVALKIARRLGIPIVGTIHTRYDFDEYLHYASPLPKSWVRFVLRRMIRHFCNGCQAITTPAYDMGDYLHTLGVTTPIHVIPNGIDLTPFQRPSNAQVVPDSDASVLFVGRLAQEKNLRFLLQSFAGVLESRPNTSLLIAGDGPDRENLQGLARKLAIAPRVQFLGWVPPHEVAALYKSASLFVMPSNSEVNPLCLIEALAAGLPTVAIDTPSARQVLHHECDALLTAHDLNAFSSAVVQLLNDDAQRQNMVRCAQNNAEIHSVSRQVDSLLALYDDLLTVRVQAP